MSSKRKTRRAKLLAQKRRRMKGVVGGSRSLGKETRRGELGGQGKEQKVPGEQVYAYPVGLIKRDLAWSLSMAGVMLVIEGVLYLLWVGGWRLG